MDHHHSDIKTATKVRFADSTRTETEAPTANDAPSPPLADSDEKDNQDKVIIVSLYVTGISYRCTRLGMLT